MKNLSKLALCAAVLFGACNANGMIFFSSRSFETRDQQAKVGEKTQNEAEANSTKVKDQTKDQKNDSVEQQKDTDASAENE